MAQRFRAGSRARRLAALIACGGGAVGAGSAALGQSGNLELEAVPITLQWFEVSWKQIEHRMPDFFLAGYGSTWLPPISIASDPTSPGYDVFDRFDLGSPSTPTIYGTEQGFRAMVDEFHRAGAEVYVDAIFNHNSGRNGSSQFIADGGFPGFWMNPPGPHATGFGNWGDFNDGSTQSINSGAPNFDLFNGDLLSLIDINQLSNNQFIRHPVNPSDPNNLPAGLVRNQSDPLNARLYPDRNLPPTVVNNPGISRANFGFGAFNLPPRSVTLYPFNAVDAAQGDAVTGNAAQMLARWAQWLVEDIGVDGFRLDAAKHVTPTFWDREFDEAMFQRRRAPGGSLVTPFSFGESIESPSVIHNYWFRKDGFGNRDALDLSNAGELRNLIGAKGAGFIGNVNNNTIDTVDDGLNNGSAGVRHILSHDNGSTGSGGSAPAFPFEDKIGFWAHAYMIMRPGHNIVYHNAREMHARFGTSRGGFWPKEGVPTALGFGSFEHFDPWVERCRPVRDGPSAFSLVTGFDDRIPTLVQLSNRYGRGWFVPRLSNDGSVYIYTRRTPNMVDNVLVAVNDEYDACSVSFDQRTVSTNFPQGLTLVELTGNAANPEVDPTGVIPDTITVGAGGSVTVLVPRNTTRFNGVHTEHNRGYVVYGPATPNGTIQIVGASQTLPPDNPATPTFARRLTSVDVVQAATFEINVMTDRTGYPAGDVNFDNRALFRIDGGFRDFNANGSFDETTGEFRGAEQFLTQSSPIFGTANPNGVYRQTISADLLSEGYHYISALVFRQRAVGAEAGGMPLFNDLRRVIYVDRQAPAMQLASSTSDCFTDVTRLVVHNPDRTVTRVHLFIDSPVGTPTFGNRAAPLDRMDWDFFVTGLTPGTHQLNILALEEPSGGITVNQSVTTVTFNVPGSTGGDINRDGVINADDLYAFNLLVGFDCEADVNADNVVNAADRVLIRANARAGEGADVIVN